VNNKPGCLFCVWLLLDTVRLFVDRQRVVCLPLFATTTCWSNCSVGSLVLVGRRPPVDRRPTNTVQCMIVVILACPTSRLVSHFCVILSFCYFEPIVSLGKLNC